MNFKDIKKIKIGTEVKFKREGLICGTGYFTGIVTGRATDKNRLTEIKYTGERYGYANVLPQDLLSII